jgi:hypothetical protein
MKSLVASAAQACRASATARMNLTLVRSIEVDGDLRDNK